jgi:hypothetical protein
MYHFGKKFLKTDDFTKMFNCVFKVRVFKLYVKYCVHAWIIELNSLCPSCQGGSGSASNIKFQNIVMQNVANPIIIDQNYCDQNKPCKEQVQNFILGAIYIYPTL